MNTTKHERIFTTFAGNEIETVKLSENIPLLKEYLLEFESSLERTIKNSEIDYNYHFYFEQLTMFSKFNPDFDVKYLFELNDIERNQLSYFYYINHYKKKKNKL